MPIKKSVVQPFYLLIVFSSLGMLPNSSSGLNIFGQDDFLEVPLSKTELQKIKVNAGWAKDDQQTLIFELANGLKGPIQCGAANVELIDGRTVGKQFVPKFAIPGNTMRNASMNVVKGSMKSYALTCSCFKRKGSDECVNPLK
ncbi:MAG: hypothetical protein RL650_413 [Pseudomonadota bacterium]|jgi:hypothetical protein